MEPFGFAHLRSRGGIDASPTISNRKYKKDGSDVSKLSKSLALSVSRLYYPVNTPVCRYQRRLILDSLYNNTLIALPAELDAFFVTAVTMLNFKRWFPTQKVAFICTSLESSLNAAKRFVEITGYSKGICVYAILKKCDRYVKWVEHDIIFATAESLISDFKSGEALSEICLMVVEDAHRAVAGSHPLSQLIRNCVFAKAKFRVLAYTDCKIDKVGQLQLIVMNLQIDLIRSLGSLKDDVSLAIASPRMNKLYVAIDEDMRHISKQLLIAVESIASLLCECGIFPTNDLSKLVNFSTSYLQKVLLNRGSHLAELYCDFLDLLSAHDILICEGLTAFGNSLQALASRSTTISGIIESNDILKACLLPGPDYFLCHKLDILVALLKKTRAHYDSQKSKVVVLCRDRDPAFVNGLLATIKARLSWKESGFAFFLVKSGNEYQVKISEEMSKDGLCNVVVVPCGFDLPELNIGYVDSLICMDEGLCTLHYTSTVRVTMEGSLLALCSAGYETNIYSFLTTEGTVDCIKIECIKGLQLCNDVLRVLPLNAVPEIMEYWAQDAEWRDGLLTTAERLDFEGRLMLDDPLDTSKLIENNHRLLNFCVKGTFLCQDRPQRFTSFGHCTSISTWTRIVDKDPESLEKQALRLQNMLTSTWISEDLQLSRTHTENPTFFYSEVNKDSKTEGLNKPTNQKQMAKILSRKCPMKVSRLNRIDSASFTLPKMLQSETRLTLIEDDFVNCVERQECYRKRQKVMDEVIGKLNNMIRV